MKNPDTCRAPLARIESVAAALVATESLAAFIDSLAASNSTAAQATVQVRPCVVARR